jgi:hypothetical protein
LLSDSGTGAGSARDGAAGGEGDTQTESGPSSSPETGTDAIQDGSACEAASAGNALLFSDAAQSQYVSIPNPPPVLAAKSLTIEAWVNTTAPSINCILCKPYGTATIDSFALWFQGGTLYWGLNAGSPAAALSTSWPFTSAAWHHVAATYDGNTQEQQIFIDGALKSVIVTSQGAPVYDTQPLLIGADINDGVVSVGFSGTIDEMYLFGSVRTPAQIAMDLTGSCVPIDDPALIAYYSFNEGSGTIAHDASPNHLDGTLGSGAAGSGMAPAWTASTLGF